MYHVVCYIIIAVLRTAIQFESCEATWNCYYARQHGKICICKYCNKLL